MSPLILKIVNILQIPRLALSLFQAPRILLYHGVTDRHAFPDIENYRTKHISREVFLQQIKFLQSHFRIVSLKDLVKTWIRSPRQARGMLAITFDDGYQNIFRVAWSILQKYNVPFTVFLPTDFIDQQIPLWVDRLEFAIGKTKNAKLQITLNKNDFFFPLGTREEKIQADTVIRDYAKSIPDIKRQRLVEEVVKKCGMDLGNYLSEEPDYRPLSWNEILEMVNSGLVLIGSHTTNHAIATRLLPEEFRQNIIDSKNLIEKQLNIKYSFFAYPNGQPGDFSKKTNSILKENNFDLAFTTEMKLWGSNTDFFALPRLAMDETENQELFLVTISEVRTFLRAIRDFFTLRSHLDKISETEIISYFDKQAIDYKDGYDALTPRGYSFRLRRKRVIELLSDLPQGAKILDVGCGPGVYTQAFLDCGFEVWGIDPAPEMIKTAQDRFNKNPRTHFRVGRVESLPFSDGLFKAVVAAGLFEYLDSAKVGFREVNRILSKEGIFIATFPFLWSLPRMWDRLVISPVAKVIRYFWKRPPVIDSKEFSVKQVVKLLKESGFSVQKVVFYNSRLIWTPFDRLFPKLSYWLSKNTENLTPSFLKTGFIVKAIRID